jgi:hypothetical protein
MALSKATLDAIREAVVEAVAVAAPPVAPQAGTATMLKRDGTPSSVKGFPCTADGGCGRVLRTAKRAALHGIETGGHSAA